MDWRVLKGQGNDCFNRGEYTDAQQLYNKALDIASSASASNDELGALYSNRSAACHRAGLHRTGLDDARSCINLRPRWPKGYYRAAQSLLSLGRRPEATAMLQVAQRQCGPNQEVAALLAELQVSREAQGPDAVPISVAAPLGAPALRPDAIPQQLRHGHIFQSSADRVDHNLLLLLHGLGDTAAPYARLAKQLALPQTASLALCGPLSVPETQGGRAWFTAFDSEGELLQVWPRLLLLHPASPLASQLAVVQSSTHIISSICSGSTAVLVLGPGSTAVLALGPGSTAVLVLGTGSTAVLVLGSGTHHHQAASAGRVRADSLEVSVAALQQLLHGLEACGWPPARVHLFGFSQGGATALELARRSRGLRRLGGCAVVAAGLLEEMISLPGGPGRPEGGGDGGDSEADTPVVMVHGDRDDVVPLSRAERTREVLREEGVVAELHVVQGKGHSMLGGRQEVRPLMAFWGRTLSHRPAGEGLVEVRS